MKSIFDQIDSPPTDYIPKLDVDTTNPLPDKSRRRDLKIPSINEVTLVRHFTNLSRNNFGVDQGFYPLGSCTMKYNPKVNEVLAGLERFVGAHPLSDEQEIQGCLELMYNLEQNLSKITGLEHVSLQPAAGAHGELTGLMIVKKYFQKKKEQRSSVITTDSSHGTNPASTTMCGFQTITLKTNSKGTVDIEALKSSLTKDIAAIMLTVPNTLGIFEKDILQITKLAHDNGTLVYMDGANLNALVSMVRPKDMGIDILHLNLHKTFSTPHGCGGPGSGPIAVSGELKNFLPVPRIIKQGPLYTFYHNLPDSIGKVKSFYGNFLVMVKAYAYIKALGNTGLRDVAQHAVLNANYLKEVLKGHYNLPYDHLCKHEFVLDDSTLSNGVTTLDLAKRLIDYGFHPPTIYFPLIVHGAIMIEPTETENKATLDKFANAMIKIKEESKNDPNLVKTAPHITPVSRLNEVQAARNPILRHKESE